MAPREGNSIVKHGVLDPRLNVWGTKGLKCADLSICPGKQKNLAFQLTFRGFELINYKIMWAVILTQLLSPLARRQLF